MGTGGKLFVLGTGLFMLANGALGSGLVALALAVSAKHVFKRALTDKSAVLHARARAHLEAQLVAAADDESKRRNLVAKLKAVAEREALDLKGHERLSDILGLGVFAAPATAVVIAAAIVSNRLGESVTSGDNPRT